MIKDVIEAYKAALKMANPAQKKAIFEEIEQLQMALYGLLQAADNSTQN